MKKCYPLIAFLVLQTVSFGATVIWNDDFSGSSLNSNFAVHRNYGDMTASQADGRLTFNGGRGTNFADVHVITSTDQNGNAEIGSASVFNFFEHALSVKIEGPTFSGGITSGIPYSSFILVGTPNGGDPLNLMPRAAFSGAFARIDYAPGGVWSIAVGDRVIGAGAITETLNITGAPSSVEFILDGNQWRMILEGATFSGGSSMADGTFTQISASDLEAQTWFSMGIVNAGDLASGSAPYSFSIDGLTISETQAIPEPGSVVLLTAGVALLGFGVARCRKEAA